jgi:hypothetical protein
VIGWAVGHRQSAVEAKPALAQPEGFLSDCPLPAANCPSQ